MEALDATHVACVDAPSHHQSSDHGPLKAVPCYDGDSEGSRMI